MLNNAPAHAVMRILLVCCAMALPTRIYAEDRVVTQAGENDRLMLILKNMPINSDKRCIGIAGVEEALLDGMEAEANDTADDVDPLARRIFESFATGKAVSYPAQLTIEGRPQAITSKAALDTLVTAVADVYKSNHVRLAESDEGIEQLLAAEGSHVQDLAELDQALAADPDQLDFFCCFGRRWFPDGSVKETNHAVLLRRNADGPPTVFDPNDPGTPQQAKYFETESGLEVEWTCPYRDTGLTTTQRYRIVPKGRFFSLALNKEPVPRPATAESPRD